MIECSTHSLDVVAVLHPLLQGGSRQFPAIGLLRARSSWRWNELKDQFEDDSEGLYSDIEIISINYLRVGSRRAVLSSCCADAGENIESPELYAVHITFQIASLENILFDRWRQCAHC